MKHMQTTQMLKGIIDGCILSIISEGEVYGYELASKLDHYGFEAFSEGTIYPILIRLQKDQLIQSTLKKSTAGPKRKYYALTKKGEEELKSFQKRWIHLSTTVNQILNKESE